MYEGLHCYVIYGYCILILLYVTLVGRFVRPNEIILMSRQMNGYIDKQSCDQLALFHKCCFLLVIIFGCVSIFMQKMFFSAINILEIETQLIFRIKVFFCQQLSLEPSRIVFSCSELGNSEGCLQEYILLALGQLRYRFYCWSLQQ